MVKAHCLSWVRFHLKGVTLHVILVLSRDCSWLGQLAVVHKLALHANFTCDHITSSLALQITAVVERRSSSATGVYESTLAHWVANALHIHVLHGALLALSESLLQRVRALELLLI